MSLCIEIPKDFIDTHKDVVLFVDILHIDGITFLLTLSKNVCLIVIWCIKDRKEETPLEDVDDTESDRDEEFESNDEKANNILHKCHVVGNLDKDFFERLNKDGHKSKTTICQLKTTQVLCCVVGKSWQ